MYLKSIEVHGFKSFANKLIFEFHNGITGIVGPNGSGKSNVADAVRWVLGEQSAKQLRGTNMQDIIFSGTETRKPQSYAYVALTISNEDHKLSLPYEEIQVARRVYRSGESEYLLNGASCRLKDVQELFFDTGIGKEGYSIIGQGQIDKILSGKPEERRELFDEAAGIVKFKKRKAAAEKSLAVESQNLLRIQDIMSELEKQVEPLAEQSGKAKEYLNLKEELKRFEIGLFCMDYESLKNEMEEIEKNAENTKKELEEAKREKEETRSQYDAAEEEISGFDRSIERKKEKVNKDKLLMTNFESEVRITKEKITSATEGKEYYKERMDVLLSSQKEMEAELSGYKESQKQALSKLAALQEKENQAKNSLAELEHVIEKKEEQLNIENEAILEAMNRSAGITVERQKAKSMMEQNSIRRAELNQKILTNKSQLAEAVEAMEREKDASAKAKKELDEEYVARKAMLSEADAAAQQIKEQQREQQEIQKKCQMEESRLAALQNIAERYEGYGHSVRRIMEQKDKNSGLLGVVADIIQVEHKYETAVETALGGNIQNIVTEDESVAKEMIAFLKKIRGGRATFLPLTALTPKKDKPFTKELLAGQGVLGNMADFVKREKKYDKVVEYLLGRYLLVDTIDNALALSRANNYSIRIVTLEGELINPGGSLSGGAFKNNSNLLGRRREMEELEGNVKKFLKEIDVLLNEIEETKEKRNKLRLSLEEDKSSLQRKFIEQNTARLNVIKAEERKEEASEGSLELKSEEQEIENQIQEIKLNKQEIQKELEESELLEKKIEQQIRKFQVELDEKRKEESVQSAHVSEWDVEVEKMLQQQDFHQQNVNRIDGEIGRYAGELKEIEEGLKTNSEDTINKQNSILSIEQTIQASHTSQGDTEKKLKEDMEKKEQLSLKQKNFFTDRETLAEKMTGLDKEVYRLNAQKEKLQESLEGQINYMWDEYEITLSDAASLRNEEMTDLSAMKKESASLKDQIKKLGDVNVNAIEDFRNLMERYQFLKTQHDDLVEAEKTLEGIIVELDAAMRKQFTEKFAEIVREFDKVFKELFGGGKGTLELMEDEDILEAGIRIVAQPPGKKLQNMMQLSGGEKALTAIALLFAIQNLKPSPFCLLDEIEAALDENNVSRFASYLHKLTKNTQFIVITHRRGTMEKADRLYGITMQEKGVSTLVSVNLIDKELDD